MRLLGLRADGIVLPTIHDSMVAAFRALGMEVENIPVREFRQASGPTGFFKGFQAAFILDAGVAPDFTSSLKDLQDWLRIPWLVWFLDDPEGYGFPDCCHPDYTIPFCWDREICAELNRGVAWKGKPIVHLPLATDPSLFFREALPSVYSGGCFVGSTAHANAFLEKAGQNPELQEAADKIWTTYREDLGQPLHALAWNMLAQLMGRSVNGLRRDPLVLMWIRALLLRIGVKKRVELVSALIGPGGVVFGDRTWQDLLEKKPVYAGEVRYGEDLRCVYNGSAFVLDIRQPQSRSGLTQRIFDAGACGAPVLAERSPEMDTLCDSEGKIFSFRNLEEARENKERILKDPQEAAKRAQTLTQSILSRHTYLHRARTMVETLRLN
jgi:hypothetical protein